MGVKVAIEVDGPARVGETLEATVILKTDAAREIDGITLEFAGETLLWSRDDTAAQPVLRDTQRLAEATHLAPGERRFRAKIRLAPDLPPSSTGDVYTRYTLRARVEIPWRFDPTVVASVTILPKAPAARGEPRRVTAFSRPHGHQPFLELSLDDSAWAPGETITGAFSIGNVDAMRLDGATVSVVPVGDAIALGIPGGSSVFRSIVGLREGGVIGFALPLPEATVPSFVSRVGSVKRAVALRIDGSDAECAIPIVIDAFEPRTIPAAEGRDPVGVARWRDVWREEGRRHGLSIDKVGLHLRGELASGVHADVRPRGNWIGATLSWESLDIGLQIEPLELLQRGGVDLARSCPRLSRSHVVRGRDEAQVRALIEPELGKLLGPFDRIDLSDTGGKLVLHVPARERDALQGFLVAIDRVAEAVMEAAPAIPPPAWAAGSVDAWKAFAEATAGRLSMGGMSVRGAIVDGDRVHVETVLDDDGQPAATRVTVVLDPEIEVDARAPLTAPKELGTPRRFDVRADAVVVEIGGFMRDPAEARALVAEMQRLVTRLRGETSRGPYR